MPHSLLLELAPRLTPSRYQLRTITTVQVGTTKFENELLYVVEQRVLAREATGYVVEVLVQHAMQKAEDVFSRVVADLNQASQRLVVQTDRHGNLVRVDNQPEVYQRWLALRPELLKKYAAEPTVAPFLEGFGQQLAVPGSMEANLRHKGVLGALLVGLYGHPLGALDTAPVQTKRCITGFFGELDLPLLLTSGTQAPPPEPVPTTMSAVYVGTIGALDPDAFNVVAFRRLMRDLVDDFKFPVALEVDCAQAHVFDQLSGALLHSTQRLRAEVPGVYYNATAHELVVQPAA